MKPSIHWMHSHTRYFLRYIQHIFEVIANLIIYLKFKKNNKL